MRYKDYKRQHIILFWLFRTVMITMAIIIVVDNFVIFINGSDEISIHYSTPRRIMVDITIPILYIILSCIRLNKKLAEYDYQLGVNQKLSGNKGKNLSGKATNTQNETSVDYLAEQADKFQIAVSNGESSTGVDWKYLDGENKERFTKELSKLSRLDETSYQRTILYMWDKLLSSYNKVQDYIVSLGEQRSKEYCSMLQIEQEVFSYIAAAYYHSIFKDPCFCYRTILNKLGREVNGSGEADLIKRSADYCNISESLMLRYRHDQCVKCQVFGCKGRVEEKNGKLDLANLHSNDIPPHVMKETIKNTDIASTKSDILEQFKTKYGEDSAGNYLQSVIAMLGYYPDITFRRLKEPWEWSIETYNKPFDFKWPENLEEPLTKLVFDKIERSKDDEKELEAVVFSLISPFEKTCHTLFPKPVDNSYVNGAIALSAYSMDDSQTLDKFKEKWDLSFSEAKKISKEQQLSDIEYIWVLNHAIQEKKGILPFGFGNTDIDKISSIVEALHFYATIIEAALLRYGLHRDIFSYMRDSNVFLTNFVDEYEIGALMDMNDSQVSTLVSRYGHSLTATSEDVFSVAIENYAFDRDVNLEAISKSDFKQMLQNMAERINAGGLQLAVKPEESESCEHPEDSDATEKENTDKTEHNDKLPRVITDELRAYLTAFFNEDYLDQNFRWRKVNGHTLYHAGWMAKIIICNVPDITYGRIEEILGVKGLTDAASKCSTQKKNTKMKEIEAVCDKYNLPKKAY